MDENENYAFKVGYALGLVSAFLFVAAVWLSVHVSIVWK